MPAAPFDIDLVIERIRSGLTESELRQVRGAADYASITKLQDFAPPEAFVLLARERGTSTGQGRQPAEVYIGVVIAARNYRAQRGKPAMDEARPLIGKLRDHLIGWTPVNADGSFIPGARPMQWVQGDMLDYSAATVLWSEVFKTQHFIGSNPS